MKENTENLGPVHLGLVHVTQCLLSPGAWRQGRKGWRRSDPEREDPLHEWGADGSEVRGACCEGSFSQQGIG